MKRGQLLVDVHVPLTVSTVAKKRWVSLRALAHGFKASSVGTWKSVVAGAKVAVELKQMMNFQRTSAQAVTQEMSSLSTSDLIIAFVKDSVPASFMRYVHAIWTTRCCRTTPPFAAIVSAHHVFLLACLLACSLASYHFG